MVRAASVVEPSHASLPPPPARRPPIPLRLSKEQFFERQWIIDTAACKIRATHALDHPETQEAFQALVKAKSVLLTPECCSHCQQGHTYICLHVGQLRSRYDLTRTCYPGHLTLAYAAQVSDWELQELTTRLTVKLRAWCVLPPQDRPAELLAWKQLDVYQRGVGLYGMERSLSRFIEWESPDALLHEIADNDWVVDLRTSVDYQDQPHPTEVLEQQVRRFHNRDVQRSGHARGRARALQSHKGAFLLQQTNPNLDATLSAELRDLLFYLTDDIKHNPVCHPSVVIQEQGWHITPPGPKDDLFTELEIETGDWEAWSVARLRHCHAA